MPKALRVLHATPAYAPAYRYGGPIRSVEGLARELARLGVDVRVLTTDAHGAERLEVPPGWHLRDGVAVCYTPRAFEPDLAPAFIWRALGSSLDCDVVHVTALFSVPSAVALIAAAVARKPVVFSPRGAFETPALASGKSAAKAAWVSVMRPFLKRAVFHATSEQERDSIRRALGQAVDVEVIPNGVAPEPALDAAARRDRVAVGSSFRIGAMGRIHPIKALERLIEATSLLVRDGADVSLEIAGPVADAAYAESLRTLATSLGIASRVSFIGEQVGEEKLDFHARNQVLCLCSLTENFGNVVVESLAAFTPVVAVRGTPWEVLERAHAGASVANEPLQIARAIERFYRDDSARDAAGRNGRKLVEERYTWRAVAARMLALYERVAAA